MKYFTIDGLWPVYVKIDKSDDINKCIPVCGNIRLNHSSVRPHTISQEFNTTQEAMDYLISSYFIEDEYWKGQVNALRKKIFYEDLLND